MLRSYHVQDYGWTPLSQNLSWKRRYDAFPGVTWITLGLRVQDHNIVQPGLGVKFGVVVLKNNFKYRKRQIFCIWLKTERGIVRTRVAMCHDLLRFSLSSRFVCLSALRQREKKNTYLSVLGFSIRRWGSVAEEIRVRDIIVFVLGGDPSRQRMSWVLVSVNLPCKSVYWYEIAQGDLRAWF